MDKRNSTPSFRERLTKDVSIGLIGAGALTLSACGSAKNDAPAPAPSSSSTTNTPGEQRPSAEATETAPAGVIDVYTGEVIPAEVQRLIDMDVAEFYEQDDDTQVLLFSYKFAHPGYYGFVDSEVKPVAGWLDWHELDDSYNPINRPASWDDSAEDVLSQMTFVGDAINAQYIMNEFSAENQPDIPMIKKLLGATFHDIGGILARKDYTTDVVRERIEFYDAVPADFTGSIGYGAKEILVEDLGEVEGLDIDQNPTRHRVIVVKSSETDRVVQLEATILNSTGYDGKPFSSWITDNVVLVQ